MKYFKPTGLILSSLLLILALGYGISGAQDNALKSSMKDKKDPIEITSDRMRSEERGQKIIFSGNVLAVWGDLSIRSDILEIYNHSDEKQPASPTGDPTSAALGQGQQLEEIVAIGNVDVRRGDRRAKGDRAIYLDKQQKIILKGSPKAIAWEGENIVEGKEMIFFLETDRFQVNDRVRIRLFPGSDGPQKAGASSRGKTASTPR